MRRRASRVGRTVPLAALLAALLPGWAAAQDEAPLVERVEIQGNQYVQKETLLFYISTKAGDRYDERRLREDFRRLWGTGFLSDLRLDALDTPQGRKVVVFTLQERRRVQIVDYRGSKALSKSNIEDELKKKDVVLRIDSFYDAARARQVEAIIRGMLTEKGRSFGTVKHEAKNVGGAGVQVTFTIDDGPPTKVKTIEFEGNQVFSDGKLRGQMKKIKTSGFWNLSWLGGKSKFTDEKWGEDQEKIRDHYLNNGYVTAVVGQPAITYTDGKSGFFKKKPVKWMHLAIPVTEGGQYRVGSVAFDGLTVFKEEGIRPLFKLQTGDVYNDSKLKKAYEKLRDFYGAQGFFQWTGYTERKPDHEKKVVDIVLHMEEDKRYYVGKISFTGNDTTRDKVIRREVYLNEGEVFNTELLKLSIKRINQLGYFKPMEGPPQLGPNPKAEDKIDLTFKVEEQNRNQFTFGGGVSGLEGTFLNASFSTANFLGLGETFQVSLQTGRRTKNYQIAVTEPYLFDRPITAGFDIYKRRLEYQTYATEGILGYIDDRTGISLVTGLPVGRFTRAFVNYAWEVVKIEQSAEPVNPFDPTLPTVSSAYIYEDPGTRYESRFTPSLVYNTVDNPWSPRSGWKVTTTAQLTGGPLGGTLNYFRPTLEFIRYIPHTRRTALGLRAETGWIFPFAETSELNPETGLSSLPYYLRYFLGGENQIRGYNIRAVGPRGPSGVVLGGDRFFLFNAEYYIDIVGPLRFLFFFDAGQAYLKGEQIDLGQLRYSTGAEIRFIMPVLNVPFRLIYAYNPNRDPFVPRTTFKFAVGTTF